MTIKTQKLSENESIMSLNNPDDINIIIEQQIKQINDEWISEPVIEMSKLVHHKREKLSESQLAVLCGHLKENHAIFLQILEYCSALPFAVGYGMDDENKLEFLKHERYRGALEQFDYWNVENKACVHANSLLYTLITKGGIIPEENVKFFQGYYEYEFPKGSIPSLMAKSAIIPHAYITINGVIFDAVVSQLNRYFPGVEYFTCLDYVIDDLNYYGQEQDKKIPLRYCKMAAKKSGLDFNVWLDRHHKLAMTMPIIID